MGHRVPGGSQGGRAHRVELCQPCQRRVCAAASPLPGRVRSPSVRPGVCCTPAHPAGISGGFRPLSSLSLPFCFQGWVAPRSPPESGGPCGSEPLSASSSWPGVPGLSSPELLAGRDSSLQKGLDVFISAACPLSLQDSCFHVILELLMKLRSSE